MQSVSKSSLVMVKLIDFSSLLLFRLAEVARTRLREGNPRYSKFWQTIFLVYREEGRRGLYRGMVTQLCRQIPNTAIMMVTYEFVVYGLSRKVIPTLLIVTVPVLCKIGCVGTVLVHYSYHVTNQVWGFPVLGGGGTSRPIRRNRLSWRQRRRRRDSRVGTPVQRRMQMAAKGAAATSDPS